MATRGTAGRFVWPPPPQAPQPPDGAATAMLEPAVVFAQEFTQEARARFVLAPTDLVGAPTGESAEGRAAQKSVSNLLRAEGRGVDSQDLADLAIRAFYACTRPRAQVHVTWARYAFDQIALHREQGLWSGLPPRFALDAAQRGIDYDALLRTCGAKANDSEVLLTVMAVLYEKGHHSEAVALADRLPRERAADPKIVLQKAESLRKMGHHRHALQLVRPLQQAYGLLATQSPWRDSFGRDPADVRDHALIIELFCLQRLWTWHQRDPQVPSLNSAEKSRVRNFCRGGPGFVMTEASAHYRRWLCWRAFCCAIDDPELKIALAGRRNWLEDGLTEALRTVRPGPLRDDMINALRCIGAVRREAARAQNLVT